MPELKKLDLNENPAQVVTKTVNTAVDTVTDTTRKTATAVSETVPHIKKNPHLAVFLILAILLGVGTGYIINQYVLPSGTISDPSAANIDSSSVKVGDIIGATDKTAFPDEAEGVLEKGGIDGEGSHKLLRPGGAAQTVYLTSSVVDLDALVGHKILVWGETFAAQKAGWLMDVGGVEILELNAQKPE